MNRLLNNDDDRVRYTFSYQSDDRSIDTTIHMNEDEVWGEVVTHFLDFLSGVYGYDIKKFVDYKDNPNNLPVKSEDIPDIIVFNEDNT